MKNRYTYFLLITLFFSVMNLESLYAQISINNVMGNKIRNTEGYEGIEGSPYFIKDWLAVNVIFASGVEGKVEYARYDLFLDQLFFSDSKQVEEFAFVEPIGAFTLRGAIFQYNFPPIGNFNKSSYYQVIAKAKFSLLKKEENIIGERTAVGTPSIRYFKKNTRYYIYNGNTMVVVKQDSKSLAEGLGVKKEDLDKYAKENSLSFKNDLDLKVIFENFSK